MTIGSPGSRAGCFCTCAGSLTAQGSAAPHVFGTSDIAFHFLLRCRHPGVSYFRGSMAGLYMPLSTLQGWPRGQPHMTQGRYGSLDLYRMTLSFTTTCRFIPALSGGKTMPAGGKIGILTGGGDVPGLNPVIKSVVYRASEMGRDVIGVRKGWEGLTHMNVTNETDSMYICRLTRENTRTI